MPKPFISSSKIEEQAVFSIKDISTLWKMRYLNRFKKDGSVWQERGDGEYFYNEDDLVKAFGEGLLTIQARPRMDYLKVRKYIKAHKISVSRLSACLGFSRQMTGEVVKGYRPVTENFRTQWERYFKESIDALMFKEGEYEARFRELNLAPKKRVAKKEVPENGKA